MKKTLRMMGLCALIALAAVGCKKNEQKDTMTFKANLPQPACDAKTHIGSGNWLMWNAGDQIKVYTADKNEDNAATFTTTDADQTTANFSGTLDQSELYYAFYPTAGVELNADGKFMLPVSATQTFVESNFTTNTFPMCATSTDGTFNFRSPYGILGIPMTGDATIGSIVLVDTLGMPLAGYYAMDANDTTFVGTGNAITLDFGTGVTLDATTPTTAYFIVPAGVFTSGFTASVKGTDGSTILNLGTNKPNTILKESIHIMPATTVNATPASTVPEGAVNGLFSVSPTLKVYFSQGNLQFKAAGSYVDLTFGDIKGGTWRFAEHQWDFVGGYCQSDNNQHGNVYEGGVKCDNTLLASDYTGWIDLFAWGTSGYNHGATYYQPWASTSYNSDDYNVYGSVTTSLFDGDGRADWGYNAIVNGGNTENSGWRTLKTEEWQYVIGLVKNSAGGYDVTGRIADGKTAAGLSLAFATVNGVKGMILLPDNWTAATYSLNYVNEVTKDAFTNNVIDAATWAASLEANGAVFLPITGYRAFGKYYCRNNDEQSSYQSSTHYSGAAYIMDFGMSLNWDNWVYYLELNPSSYVSRYYANPVRLARNAN